MFNLAALLCLVAPIFVVSMLFTVFRENKTYCKHGSKYIDYKVDINSVNVFADSLIEYALIT
jgi:hypothetical protein